MTYLEKIQQLLAENNQLKQELEKERSKPAHIIHEPAKPKLVLIDNRKFTKVTMNEILCINRSLVEENECYREYVQKTEEIERLYQEAVQEQKRLEDDMIIYEQAMDDDKEEINRLRNEILQLRGKIQSYEIMLNSQRDKFENQAIILEGKEKDLYEGEQRDIVIELLKNKLDTLQPGVRQYDVIKSLLANNQESGLRRRIKETIVSALRKSEGISNMSHSDEKELREIGFEIQKSSSEHPKIVFGKYIFASPNTPRDPRSMMNLASQICNTL